VGAALIHAANDYSIEPGKALGTEMARLGKPHRVKIYPPVGRTADEGHDFVHLGVATWGSPMCSPSWMNTCGGEPRLPAGFKEVRGERGTAARGL
jgi:hypothetical protein